MQIFWPIALFFLLIGILLYVLYRITQRDYWRRLSGNLKPCPFGKEITTELRREGGKFNQIGVISYSLYGNFQKYLPTLLQSLEIISKEMVRWQPRVYVSESVSSVSIQEILSKGAEVIVMSNPKGHEGALWRFLPGKEGLTFVSLDADDVFDRTNEIRAWIQSRKPFGLFNRNKFLLPMTAGTWGALSGELFGIQEQLDQYCEHWFGFDEAFLYQIIWPKVEAQGYWEAPGISWRGLFLGLLCGIVLLAGVIMMTSY